MEQKGSRPIEAAILQEVETRVHGGAGLFRFKEIVEKILVQVSRPQGNRAHERQARAFHPRHRKGSRSEHLLRRGGSKSLGRKGGYEEPASKPYRSRGKAGRLGAQAFSGTRAVYPEEYASGILQQGRHERRGQKALPQGGGFDGTQAVVRPHVVQGAAGVDQYSPDLDFSTQGGQGEPGYPVVGAVGEMALKSRIVQGFAYHPGNLRPWAGRVKPYRSVV